MNLERQLVFFSFYHSDYSRSGVYLKSKPLSNFGYKFHKINFGLFAASKDINQILRGKDRTTTTVVILSPSHILAVVVRLLWRGTIVLDAGWPLTDATISRTKGIRTFSKLARSYLMDFISFKCASQIVLESHAQLTRCSKIFLVPQSKLKVVFTGFDEESDLESEITVSEISQMDESKPLVTFRGSYNPESGLDIILKMSQLPDSNKFNLLICSNVNFPDIEHTENLTVTRRRLNPQEFSSIYRSSRIVIGQISQHKRLAYTIPHKAFEAGYFGKAYISASNPAIRELFPSEEEALYAVNFDEHNLLEAILKLLADTSLQKTLEHSIRDRYQQVASQTALGSQFLDIVLSSTSE